MHRKSSFFLLCATIVFTAYGMQSEQEMTRRLCEPLLQSTETRAKIFAKIRCAIFNNDSQKLQELLTENASIIPYCDYNDSFLYEAINSNNPMCLTLLIKAGMEVNLHRLKLKAKNFVHRRECFEVLKTAPLDIQNAQSYRSIRAYLKKFDEECNSLKLPKKQTQEKAV